MYVQPPPGVDLVTTALLIMVKLEKKNFSWENAKKMMAKVDAFKEQLEEYRGEDIPEVNRRLRIANPYQEGAAGGLEALIDPKNRIK